MSEKKDITSKITSKGQTTIPKTIRNLLDLQSGDYILFSVENNEITISKYSHQNEFNEEYVKEEMKEYLISFKKQ